MLFSGKSQDSPDIIHVFYNNEIKEFINLYPKIIVIFEV